MRHNPRRTDDHAGDVGAASRTRPPSFVGASYARFSSSLQDESSIEQQNQRCLEKAAGDGVTIPTRLQFADHAISGTKRDRPGLKALEQAATRGEFQVLYVDSLSRIARESAFCIPLVKNLADNHHIRVVSVTDGLDSTTPRWSLHLCIQASIAEDYVSALRDSVRRGQQHVINNDWSVGSHCFGYTSEVIEGSQRGRLQRPRKRVVIHEANATWVKQIFRWFVEDRRSIRWITRQLTEMEAPKDHRATTAAWHASSVKRVLSNPKYVGLWEWGKLTNRRDPLTGTVRQEAAPAEWVRQNTRQYDDRRIIDDETFERAQERLLEQRRRYSSWRDSRGRFVGSEAGRTVTRHLLQNLIKCGHCGRSFQVAGSGGQYLRCGGYPQGACSSSTGLRREQAQTEILNEVGKRLLRDPTWANAVFVEAERAFHMRVTEPSCGIEQLEMKLTEVNRTVKNLLDAVEGGDELESLTKRLREREEEKLRLESALASARRRQAQQPGPPSREWVTESLRQLGTVLDGGDQAGNALLLGLLGPITAREVIPSGKTRGYIELELELSSSKVANRVSETGVATESAPAKVERITITFAKSPAWACHIDAVVELFHRGVPHGDIADRLEIPSHWVTKALTKWHRDRNLPLPDGRRNRKCRPQEPQAVALAERAKELYDQDLLHKDIASKLGCGRGTVAAAIEYWFASRGQEVPDGRRRRRQIRLRRSALTNLSHDGSAQ